MHDESNGEMRKVTKEKGIRGNAAKEKGIRGKTKKGEVINKAAPKNVVREDEMEMAAARNNMLILLEQMRQKGVKLFVDGESALPGEIASKAVCEGSTYMADYVLGENGTIEQVRFDKVTRR